MTDPVPASWFSDDADDEDEPQVDASMIVAWSFNNEARKDGWADGTCHAYINESPHGRFLGRACMPSTGYGGDLADHIERLQPHVPELPLCPKCAEIAGLAWVGAR